MANIDPGQIRPEDCPTPEYHKTHYYCPSCSWTAPDAPRSDKGKLDDLRLAVIGYRTAREQAEGEETPVVTAARNLMFDRAAE